MGRCLTAVFLLTATVMAFADADPGCAGRIREVVRLGGEQAVPGVEAIHAAQQDALKIYTGTASVQQLLQRPHSFGFVAIRDEKIAGSVVYERRDAYMLLKALSVGPAVQRQNVGTDLIERVIEEARNTPGAEDVRVVIDARDTGLKAFFVNLGFEYTEHMPRYLDGQTVTGVMLKYAFRDHGKPVPQLQAAPQPKPQVRLALKTIAITREELLRLDPSLRNAD